MAREVRRRERMTERERELARLRKVSRPVKLLALIERLENWQVDDELLSAVMETVEAGIDIDALYERGEAQIGESTVEEEEEAAKAAESVRPVPIYRFGEGSIIHFGKQGRPVSPPTQYMHYPGLNAQSCFGCELFSKRMVAPVWPHFKEGDVLIFSTEERVDSGDFAFVKLHTADLFAQVFFSGEGVVRLRPLNPKFAEESVRQHEVKETCKLIARFHRF